MVVHRRIQVGGHMALAKRAGICGFMVAIGLAAGVEAAAPPGSAVAWQLHSLDRPKQDVLLRQPLGTTENRQLVFIIDPVKYGKAPPEYVISVDSHCQANRRVGKKTSVTAYPKVEGGRYVLALPRNLAKCYKIDSKGQVEVSLELKVVADAEPLELKGVMYME